jgi:hypothetical protein
MLQVSQKVFLKDIVPIACINSIPMVGVIFFGWNVLSIVELYWIESIFIGLFNFLRLARWNAEKAPRWALIFLLHYSIFIVVMAVLLKEAYPDFLKRVGDSQWYPFSVQSIQKWLVGIPGSYLGVFLGYATSYIRETRTGASKNADTYLRTTGLAYVRIFVMQLTCMLGVGIAHISGVPAFALVCIISIKTLMDVLVSKKRRRDVDR